ncbi:hypothetical protein [Novosphingobium sp. SG720]|uniref:hypothetical protein n=1 Tax=Novosphingobium sp. SG720 TaxID=2586998 RepID=UPI0017DE1827|nr:hypothetical protein [Novosphingobium sp. SG720]NKJ41406.1 hypothetical protein [Novosphingobium sp. SG720]
MVGKKALCAVIVLPAGLAGAPATGGLAGTTGLVTRFARAARGFTSLPGIVWAA